MSRANLRGTTLDHADLSGAELTGARLKGSSFFKANIRGAKFDSAMLHDDDIDVTDHVDFSLAQYDWSTSFAGTDIDRVDWSSNPLLRRQIDDQRWLQSWRWQVSAGGWKGRLADRLWCASCDYGRSTKRWIAWSLGFAMGFGLVFLVWADRFVLGSNPAETLANAHWITPFYYSIVTFTTLGFGDVTPKPDAWMMQALVAMEVVIGYVMLGGLISIFATKLPRRRD